MKLANKHIFVTGGAKGIGEAIVRDAAAESASVTFIDIDDNAGNKLATELISSGKNVTYFHANVADFEQLKKAFESGVSKFGEVTGVVNNAGVNSHADPVTMTDKEWDDFFGDFMGSGRGGGRSKKSRSNRGSDLKINLEVSLEEAYFGKKQTINLSSNEKCEKCSGSGAEPGSKPKKCSTCDGYGKVRTQQGFFTLQQTCPDINRSTESVDPCYPSLFISGPFTFK